MVRAQAVDAVEVLRYNGRASGKGGGQVLRQLKYFQSVVRLCSFSQATEENYLSQSAISQQMQALVANDELYAVQAASAEPLEEIDPAGLVLFHALCGAQNLTKTVLIYGDRHQNRNIFILSAPVAAQVDAVHVDVWIAPALQAETSNCQS